MFDFDALFNSTINLAFPRMNLAEQDCFCPVLFQDNDSYDVKNCTCFTGTIFNESDINVYRNDDGSFSILLYNLSARISSGSIHVFHNFYCDSNYLPPYRVYTHLFKLSTGKSLNC